MVNVQEWLEKYYPDKKLEWPYSIYLNQQLEGVLDCREYKELWKIFISTQVDGSKLEIIKGSCNDGYGRKETQIIPCILAQNYLNQNYPKDGTCVRKEEKWSLNGKEVEIDNFGKKREQITKLDMMNRKDKKGLEGSLDLSDFTNLEELGCLDNYLTQIVYPSNLEKITELFIGDNNLSLSDLTIFSPMRNLKDLGIGNTDKNKINQGIYNKIEGSWETLKDLNKLEILDIENTDINSGFEYLPTSLERIYYDTKPRPNCKLALAATELEQVLWKDIHKNFTVPKHKKEWLEAGYSKEQTKEWIDAGAKPDSLKFIDWFLNFKKLDLNWAKENEEEFKELRDKYGYFGTCLECQQPNTSREWCQTCNAKHFKNEFSNWTSGNPQVDKFIRQCQLEATSDWNLLEWIPYEKFNNIEHIAQGGFGKVEKAEWEEGSIEKWDNEEWKRRGDKYKNYKAVALKTLFNSSNLNQEFLSELTLYKMFRSSVSNMVPCYGVSKDGEEGNYILVMEYMEWGNLREYLRKNYRELEVKKDEYGSIKYPKLSFLQEISQGLKDIHRKNLVHQDFHSGNIIVGDYVCHITDLGLSKPVNEVATENKIYGVMPYVAPEVLSEKPYTQASDIYSLGIIAYEILTCLPPFAEQAHDVNLALKIIQGARPNFPAQVKYPQLLVNLIKRCWDSEPNNRPTAREISGMVGEWFYNESGYDENGIYYSKGDLKTNTEFYQQYLEAKEHNKTLPDEIKYPTYQSPEVWHSKPINTQQITQLLQKTNEPFWGSKNIDLDLDNINLDELTIQENPQEQSSHQSQIETPPKK